LSVTIEHIIPESLGNTDHVLPRGWVCDKCNNYFSRKIEKPFLDSMDIKAARFEMRVPSKRKRVPPATGVHSQSRTRVSVFFGRDGELFVCADEGEDESRWINSLKTHKRGTLYLPAAQAPKIDYVVARFIAKVALEALAERALEIEGWNDELVEKRELDEIRKYVRTGNPGLIWPVNIREIYKKEAVFTEPNAQPYQVLHEWTILHTPQDEFYVIIAIFGVEYAINLGGPEIDGYVAWLQENEGVSPLEQAVENK
jgi:hypothetical protein